MAEKVKAARPRESVLRRVRDTELAAESERLSLPSSGSMWSPSVADAPFDMSPGTVLGLQGSMGNQAVQRLMVQRTVGGSFPAIQRKVVKIKSEKVEISDEKQQGLTDKAEAKQIINDTKNTYGVKLSSSTLVKAIKKDYSDAPKKVRNGVQVAPWRMVELRALAEALANYAPILGAARANSTRSGEDQEVTSVGKGNNSIDEDEPTGELDPDTLGEYFSSKKVMGLFTPSEGHTGDFPDEKDQLVGTFVHEIAHGLLSYALPKFITDTGGFWTDEDTKSGVAGAEAPITGYGETNAAEDLCETAMFYFVDPARLLGGNGGAPGAAGNPAPLRHAFMEALGTSWLPPVAQAPQIVAPDPPGAPTPIRIGGHRRGG